VKIVCCAESTRQSHIRLGYSATKMIVIPNGIDIEVFQPDGFARSQIRAELGLEDGTSLVGLCARYHPDKDHRTFFQAAGRMHTEMPDVHFVLWGKDIEPNNKTLMGWIQENDLGGRTHLLGVRSDSNRLFASVDIAALSSVTEAFPTVIGEAMACGVPCIATDVGDNRAIIDSTGVIVPRRDPDSLAKAMQDLLSRPGESRMMGEKARQRIIGQFSLNKMTIEYAALYRDIMMGVGA
jgi:glycosyltransferase involved in cell wall biosynthesis